MRKPVSVTLDTENLLWLKAQAIASDEGNVSRVLDRIVREAREAGRTGLLAGRSVKGTIGPLPEDDALTRAAAEVGAMFAESLGRSMGVVERPAEAPRRRTKRRRG
jgi:hypothetical protein